MDDDANGKTDSAESESKTSSSSSSNSTSSSCEEEESDEEGSDEEENKKEKKLEDHMVMRKEDDLARELEEGEIENLARECYQGSKTKGQACRSHKECKAS